MQRAKLPLSKPAIYRRGVIPTTAANIEEELSSSEDEPEEIQETEEATIAEKEDKKDFSSKRLQRLLEREEVDLEEQSESNEEENRRARMRERALEKQREARKEENHKAAQNALTASTSGNSRVVIAKQETSESESESSSSEEEESEEEEQFPKRVLFKPTFVPKISREIIAENEKLAKQAKEEEANRILELERRKVESSELIISTLRKEALEAQHQLEHIDLDDTDGIDEEQELAAWKVRELLRIKRAKEQREYRLVDVEDIVRRRNLSDAQIEIENQKDGKLGVEKTKLRFMQKYYHKGAFHAGNKEVEEALRRTDTSAPTLEDHQDKLILPDVMKVKNFGKAGRTKYTHLVDQDTTGLDTAWAKAENVSQNILKRMGGMKSGFDKPSKKQKKD